MSLPYDPVRDDVGMDTSYSAPSLSEYQHATSSFAVAPFRHGRIPPGEVQDDYSDAEASEDIHNTTTGSRYGRSASSSSMASGSQDDIMTPQDSFMAQQSDIIRRWATRSSQELAALLEDNMRSHVKKQYRLEAKAHREEMATTLRADLSPIVYADLRAEQLPVVRQELREEADAYYQQRMDDAENASNTYYNNECQGMEEELHSLFKSECRKCEAEIKEMRKKKMNRMEDEVENRSRRYWESERVRVTRETEEYEETRTDEITSKFEAARKELAAQEKRAYSQLDKAIKLTKRELKSEAKAEINKWKQEQRAAFEAEIASERASRLSQIDESAGIPTLAKQHPVSTEAGATRSESDSVNDKPSSLDTLSTDEKTLIVDQDENNPEEKTLIADQDEKDPEEKTLTVDQEENGPKEVQSSHEDMEKGRSVAPNNSKAPLKTAVGTKRARENRDDTESESDSVSINDKHDFSEGSTRPIKRIRHHGSSPSSFVVDTKPSDGSSPTTVPRYSRNTDAVLGAKAVVPKSCTSIQDWKYNLEAPEQEDSADTQGTRFFEASQSVTVATSSAETAAAISTGTATANSPAIVMQTSKNYQFGVYQTLVDPAIMDRAMANMFHSSKSGTTPENILPSPTAAAGEDEDDEL